MLEYVAGACTIAGLLLVPKLRGYGLVMCSNILWMVVASQLHDGALLIINTFSFILLGWRLSNSRT